MSLILGIETSCDETAAAVVEDGSIVRSNVVSSQISRHAVFGGVVPELAAREHLASIETVVDAALKEAETTIPSLDAIAVTNGPGLMPALLIGLNFAKSLAFSNSLPLIPVNHFIAHIYGSFLDGKTEMPGLKETYPLLALVVSGGHTALLLIMPDSSSEIVGTTLDDASGEAFDKGAKIMGLGYPGGPAIQKMSRGGNIAKFAFPRALTGSAGKALSPENRFNFSFSGLKTSLLKHCKKFGGEMKDAKFASDTAASYQEAICDVLFRKTLDAADYFSAATIVLCGGVACNSALREKFPKGVPGGIKLITAKPEYCTDNAAMIAACAWRCLETSERKYDIDAFSRIDKLERLPFVVNVR